ncbi:hypothetical protein AVEN_204887-1, partial [Araneus ventricosus]
MEESEDEDFGSFQQETDVAEVEEVIYLESCMVDFSTNMLILIDNVECARMKVHHSNVYGIQEVDCGEYDMTALRPTNMVKSKFVLVVNDQLVISESQLKVVLPDCIFQVDCRKEFFGFQ